MLTLAELTARHAGNGKITWIGIRPSRNAAMVSCPQVEILPKGLSGDRTTRPGNRSVTLVQHEHLPVISALAGLPEVSPELLRRNIVVDGINLLALKNEIFKIGDVTLEGTGICAPCSKMEKTLGHGGYNALRGHGGITARVIEPGQIRIGDLVSALCCVK